YRPRSLTHLPREHTEGLLAHNHKRPWRGRLARDQPVSPAVSKRTVIDLRCFLDDLALWGRAERPPRRPLGPAPQGQVVEEAAQVDHGPLADRGRDGLVAGEAAAPGPLVVVGQETLGVLAGEVGQAAGSV